VLLNVGERQREPDADDKYKTHKALQSSGLLDDVMQNSKNKNYWQLLMFMQYPSAKTA
jgi:hypothetical protein